jgi:hypothetical protein
MLPRARSVRQGTGDKEQIVRIDSLFQQSIRLGQRHFIGKRARAVTGELVRQATFDLRSQGRREDGTRFEVETWLILLRCPGPAVDETRDTS